MVLANVGVRLWKINAKLDGYFFKVKHMVHIHLRRYRRLCGKVSLGWISGTTLSWPFPVL
jgi:hypothetical protein